MTKFSKLKSLPIANLPWTDPDHEKTSFYSSEHPLCHSSLSVILVHRDAGMTTLAVEETYNILFLPFYAFPCSPNFPAWGMPEERGCSWMRSIAPNFAKRQTALNMPADRSVLWDLAVRTGTALWFGKTAWHETCLCKMQFTVSENSGINFSPLSVPPPPFYYVRKNQNMTFSIFNLSETQYTLWSATQCYQPLMLVTFLKCHFALPHNQHSYSVGPFLLMH